MNKIDVCLTPELLHLYEIKNKNVVVIDILRASSSITTALAHGIARIKPVAGLEQCRALKKQGFIIAGERDGKKADGFDLGNSPFDYMDRSLAGKTIAMTTTNGTMAISKSKDAAKVIIGSFLNKKAVVDELLRGQNDIVLLCAGWKGRFSLEDTLFAGAVVKDLANFQVEHDAALAARYLYDGVGSDLPAVIENASHAQRLKGLNIQKDIAFCLTFDKYDVVPVLKGEFLIVN
ncbi:MAG: 2-phosphosulfolactate phosphatase [Cytophagales bacterium]|nr:2-phosphosulfolactate phosphatase [Cytophagales bacterium]